MVVDLDELPRGRDLVPGCMCPSCFLRRTKSQGKAEAFIARYFGLEQKVAQTTARTRDLRGQNRLVV